MQADGQVVFPIYFVFDASSTGGVSLVDFANELILEVFETIVEDPIVDERTRLSLIELGETETSLLSLSKMSDLQRIPRIMETKSISLNSAFVSLKNWVTEDVTDLKAQGYRVVRPIAFFFLTSTSDNDEWHVSYEELAARESFIFAPNIFCFGTSSALRKDIRKIASTGNIETDELAANYLDMKFEVATLVKSIVGDFFIKMQRSYFSARVSPAAEFRFSDSVPGVHPVSKLDIDIVLEEVDPVLLGDAPINTFAIAEFENRNGVQVLPFYVVCDESSSMSGASIDAVNQGIGELFRTIHADPVVDAKARVGIITFNDTARVLLPLTQLSDISQVPGCIASGSASYAAAFRLLKSQIEADVPKLRADGFRVHRPMVFFMSDGRPNSEDWQTSLSELTDASFDFCPNIVSFGVAGAEAAVIKQVSTPFPFGASRKQSFAFLAEAGLNPGAALNEIMKFFVHS